MFIRFGSHYTSGHCQKQKKTAGRRGALRRGSRWARGLVHAVHAAGGGGRGRVFLGDVGDHGFRDEQEARDGGGVDSTCCRPQSRRQPRGTTLTPSGRV